MKRQFFCHIVNSIAKYDPWFVQKHNALERLGLFSLQKCRVAICMLVYDLPIDAYNEYFRLSESTAFEFLKRFIITIHACFESTYLRQTSYEDFKH